MTKARILIVEDEAIIARDLSQMLRKLGHTILATAMTGEEAISAAASLKPDLVLMDIRLAGKTDGVAAAIRIREEQEIPIMFLTGNTDEATLERAKAAAPLGYLPKPISERELRVWVEMGLHRVGLERRVIESERYLFSVLSAVGDAVIGTDAEWKIREFNPAAEKLTGWPAQEALGQQIADVVMLIAEDGSSLSEDPVKAAMQGNVRREWSGDQWLACRDGSRIPLAYTSSRIRDEHGAPAGLVFAFRDISERRKMEAEREHLIGELRAALESIKTLRGLIPICASCKQVRDDQGYWQHVEQYVAAHSLAEFSHSICPACIKKLYPEIADKVLNDLAADK